ncbi:MAG: hybrid sensor histidine kinase/response regulator [Aureispira sp.]
MKEESISTTKLFELNCLVTAAAVVLRLVFHIVQWAGWIPVVADGLLAIILFSFYSAARQLKQPLGRTIGWYLLVKQIAITVVWVFWGDLYSLWPPIFLLVILIYMLFFGEQYCKKLALLVSGMILLLIFAVQLQEEFFRASYAQNWTNYTQMTLYISSMVGLLLGIVNNRVEEERYRSQQQAIVLQRARKAAEQRRDLLMRLKDLQSDFFLEQDLKPSFNKLLQQLLEVTNSSYGFMGELETESSVAWMAKPHAQVTSPLFGKLSEEQQRARLSDFFKQVHDGKVPIINNNIKDNISAQRRYGLTNYLGIPVTYNYKVVGAIVLADCPDGYKEAVIEELSPFISTYGSIIQNIRLKRAQKKHENELREAKELAEESNRLKSQFLTNISHELRTPLSLILGPIDLLKQASFQQLEEEQWRQQLTLIEKNSKKMLSYIEDIVDLSKLNADHLEVQLTTIDLKDFLEGVYQEAKEAYSYRELSFSLKYPLNKRIGLYTDVNKLRKIIDNVLSNAFKYTKDGTQEHIVLQAELLTDELQIRCSDSGPGISEEHVERIFNRFYQIEQPHESIFSGTGIGLALCKELSELLDITISVKSRVGEGSCFIIHIPIDQLRKQQAPVVLEQKKVALKQTQTKVPVPTTSNKPSILVVEDNRDMRSFLKQVLQLDYTVSAVKNGREAWEMLQEHPQRFRLLITDLMMPEMDGFTLIQHIQTNATTNHLPVIVLTAKAQFDERLRSLRIGMDDYLTKPFEVEELQVMVKHLLHVRAAREKKIR